MYRYKCDHPGCTVENIGLTGRTLEDRYKEHLRVLSPIHDHANTINHHIKLDNFSIMDRESQGVTRIVKEAMFFRVSDPSSTETLTSTNYHTYGMRVCRTWQLSVHSVPSYVLLVIHGPPPPHHGVHTHPIGKCGLPGVAPLTKSTPPSPGGAFPLSNLPHHPPLPSGAKFPPIF